jgi:GNAT superfamily N-acetyltransferase
LVIINKKLGMVDNDLAVQRIGKHVTFRIEYSFVIGIVNTWWTDEWKRRSGNLFTGVRKEYRNKGIATTLKIRLAQYLKKSGYKISITKNRSTNKSILKINLPQLFTIIIFNIMIDGK